MLVVGTLHFLGFDIEVKDNFDSNDVKDAKDKFVTCYRSKKIKDLHEINSQKKYPENAKVVSIKNIRFFDNYGVEHFEKPYTIPKREVNDSTTKPDSGKNATAVRRWEKGKRKERITIELNPDDNKDMTKADLLGLDIDLPPIGKNGLNKDIPHDKSFVVYKKKATDEDSALEILRLDMLEDERETGFRSRRHKTKNHNIIE